MARYIREEFINKPQEFVDFIMSDFLRKHKFEQTTLDGELIWQDGTGMLSMPRFFKYYYQNGVIHLEAWTRTAWFPGVYGKKENDLAGFYGSVPKNAYRSDIDNLIQVLYQPLPSDQQYAQNAYNQFYNQGNPYYNQPVQNQNGYYNQPVQNQNGYYNQPVPNQPGSYNQPNMYQNGYPGQPIVVKGVDNKNLAVAGFIFSLLSIPFCFLNGFLGLLWACIGTAYSHKSLESSKKGLANAGYILGILGILIAAVAIIYLFFGEA